MANSHVSYLQTLAKDEAIAFVSSLQKVKEHLSHELQWMNEQVQQKTIQLQGVDTLLSEAVGLGLAPVHASSTQDPATAGEVNQASVTRAMLSSVSQAAPSLPFASVADANGSNLVANTTDSTTVSPSGAVVTAPTAPPQRGKQRQHNKPSPTERNAKLPAVGKTNTAQTKTGRSAQSASEASKVTSSGFQQFLQASFQDKSMTDAVGEVLDASTAPMNTDAIMAKLYDGLSNEAYQRAKSSLSNILSVGKSKGKWKSTGRGLYVGS